MRLAPLILAIASLAALTAQSAGARPAVLPCQGAQLRGSVHQSSGAAGTIAESLALRNVSPATCSLHGYAGLELVSAPTRVQHGGLAFLKLPVRTVTLRPGAYASLLIAYSDVPHGSETRCPATRSLLVTPPGSRSAVTIRAPAMACNHGLLYESPFLAGLRPVP